MKKAIVVVIALMLIAAMLVGCAQSVATEPAAEPQTAESTGTESQSAAAGAPSFKIGMSYTSFTDNLGSQFKKMAEYTCEQLGCELMASEWPSGDADGLLETVENQIQAGCDGIVGVSFATPAILSTCDKANVPYIQCCGFMSDENVIKVAEESTSYVTNIHESEYNAGYNMAQTAYDAGKKSAIFIGVALGVAPGHDQRRQAVLDFAEKNPDFKILGEFLSAAPSEWGPAMLQLLSANPEADLVIASGNDGSLPPILYNNGYKDKVKFVTCDVAAGTDTYIADGFCIYTAGGQQTSMLTAILVLYNQLCDSSYVPAENRIEGCLRNYVNIKTQEDYDTYMTYIEGDKFPYTGDELRALCPAFNPDATFEDFLKFNENFSLEDIRARLG